MENFYKSMSNHIHQHPMLQKIIRRITHDFPYITFFLYPCLLIYLFIMKSPMLLDTIWKPLGAFVLVSLFRKLLNRPRPYEAMDIVPLISHKQGESFPSRHTVSAFMIGLMCLNVHLYLGIFALIVATIMSICRILAGVHYISDVVASITIVFLFYMI